MTNGLVIGKFYPPHQGHKFLIETAASQVDHLDVIVCHHPSETIPGSLRAAWLREIHPNVSVIEVPDIGKDDDSQAWAKYTVSILGFAPDVVFTSEAYGETYAKFLGCRHVLVDQQRKSVPISATVVRKDPFKSWEFLQPCVKAHFAKRICVVGAESTGTTTIAKSLAEHYQTGWVPEYGRTYCDKKFQGRDPFECTWESDEFLHIVEEQLRQEDTSARLCNKVLFCDTDALATSIWHERYIGRRSQRLESLIDTSRYAIYLLTDCDIPFVQDGTRDGEHIRKWMTSRFREELDSRKTRWALLSGSIGERMEAATGLIDSAILATAV